MKNYKCLETIYVLNTNNVDKSTTTPNTAVITEDKIKTVFNAEGIYEQQLILNCFSIIPMQYFESVPLIFQVLETSIEMAKKKAPYVAEVLEKFRRSLWYNCDTKQEIENKIENKIFSLRNAMTILKESTPEHGLVWGNAIVFEELLRELKRQENAQ